MWFMLLILKEANQKQEDTDNAYVMLTFVKEEEIYDYV